MWSFTSLSVVVRPLLNLIRESRPSWQFAALFCLAAILAAGTVNCWRVQNSFGLNKWSGVLNCLAISSVVGYAEWLNLRPIMAWQLAACLALAGAIWITVAKAQGKPAQLPADFVHLLIRPTWRYVTPLRADFWLIWIGMWLPIALAIYALLIEFLSLRYLHRHWSWYPGYVLIIGGVAYAVTVTASLVKDRFRNLESLMFFHLSSCLLIAAIGTDGLKWPTLPTAALLLKLTEVPRDAMTKWQSRKRGEERDLYESLEAPHFGV